MSFAPPSGVLARRPRVLHFVTGGFSGATQVAVDLVRAHAESGALEPLLVLRRKRTTTPERLAAVRAQGLPVQVVPGWSHAATVWALAALCRAYRPDVLVAHGFSEHLWGRYAGLLAGVPYLVHVEHNSRERYTAWRLRQALWLSQRTAAIVGCSEGVRRSLLARGFPSDRTEAISNGIRPEPFAEAGQRPLSTREPAIVMSARFARQKDHATLLRAVALLRDRGMAPAVRLAGGGKAGVKRKLEHLRDSLGLQQQVEFLGHCADMPGLLMRHAVFVLSTHYEGMPLALIEAMAAGCAVVGTDVVGVQDVIEHGRNGLRVAHEDPAALADALHQLLTQPQEAQRMALQARQDALEQYTLQVMTQRYESLLQRVIAQPPRGHA